MDWLKEILDKVSDEVKTRPIWMQSRQVKVPESAKGVMDPNQHFITNKRGDHIPFGLFAQLMADAAEKAATSKFEGPVKYCGTESTWEDCITFEHVNGKHIAIFHFNIGKDTLYAIRTLSEGEI